MPTMAIVYIEIVIAMYHYNYIAIKTVYSNEITGIIIQGKHLVSEPVLEYFQMKLR